MNPIRTLKTIMQTVTMYTGAFCPYCTMAKKLLHSLGVAEINKSASTAAPKPLPRCSSFQDSAAYRKFSSAIPTSAVLPICTACTAKAGWILY